MKYIITLILFFTATVTADDKAWTPQELMKTKLIQDVQISSDNKYALFVVTEPNMKGEKGFALSRIYKANLQKDECYSPFTSSEYTSTQPRWSPDGKWIAFLSNRSGTNNLYLISSEGGEALVLTDGKKDVQNFAWSPDGKKIAFVRVDDLAEAKNLHKTSLAYVYKQKVEINRLWMLDVFSPQPTPKALTSDDYCVRGSGDLGTISCEFDWAPDSGTIAFAYSPGLGFDYFTLDSHLATVDIATGKINAWDKQALFEAMPRYSPDGKLIAYLSSDSAKRYAFNRRVAIRSSDGKFKKLLPPSFNEGPFLAGPSILGWYEENNILLYEPKGTKFQIAVLPLNGNYVSEIDSLDCFIGEPSVGRDRMTLGFVSQSPSSPPEVYVSDLEYFKPIKITHLNSSLNSRPKIKTEVISWKSKDDLTIEGLVTFPPDYVAGKAYPLLVVIHGGPTGFFNESFVGNPYIYPVASFAEAGFVILRPNPRGSCGYGEKFRCANYGDWGGADYLDIMTGVDALIDKGIVDEQRMGVMGWSYGGYMTAWIVGHTERFKAASIGAGVFNLISMAGTTDLHCFLADYFGEFTDKRELYVERSPISYVANITTPCLIQHGTDDTRVPVSQSYELYHILERLEKKPKMILYPGMGHRISDPKMLQDCMQSNLKWFKHHLKLE